MIEGRATSRPTAVIAATEILTDMRIASAGGESAAMGAVGGARGPAHVSLGVPRNFVIKVNLDS